MRNVAVQKTSNNKKNKYKMNGTEAMKERPSYRWENREYLLEVFMKQLGINEADLENEPSWVRAKVREANIDTLLEN